MFNRYFQQELSSLKEVGKIFSRENPAIAPMLGESSSDPDVDRLLEGVAFLTGAIRERIDDELPEVIHDFIRQIWPHYLKPLPSATIISFSPGAPGLCGQIPRDVYVKSVPIDGVNCKFKTCWPVDVPPLEIKETEYIEPKGTNPVIRLHCRLLGTTADQWDATCLRFFLGNGFKKGCDLHFVLMNFLKQICIRTGEDDPGFDMEANCLQPFGFSDEAAMIPFPSNSFKGYRLIQEYFHMPEKFLFWELKNLKNWVPRPRTDQFYIDLKLTRQPLDDFTVDKNSFVLSATPALNIFSHPAVPVNIDHQRTQYQVRPEGDKKHFQVYAIEKVAGIVKGLDDEQVISPFHSFVHHDSGFVFSEKLSRSKLDNQIEFSVCLAYPQGINTADLKTLSFDIMCTNANLPESLPHGGVCLSTVSMPEFVTAVNLVTPTTALIPPVGTPSLWHLVSILTVNANALSAPENFKSLLNLHLMKESNQNTRRMLANEKKIKGIKAMDTRNIERLVNGVLMRGLEIELTMSQNHFAGPGDFYLFGMIADLFFSLYASMNTFTRLVLVEMDTQEIYTWPERIGNRRLI